MASYHYYCIIIIIVITIIVIIITSPTTPLASGQRTPTFPRRRCPQAGLEGTEGLQAEGTAWAKAQNGKALLGAKGWRVPGQGEV